MERAFMGAGERGRARESNGCPTIFSLILRSAPTERVSKDVAGSSRDIWIILRDAAFRGSPG
jgi:hypothetical protein